MHLIANTPHMFYYININDGDGSGHTLNMVPDQNLFEPHERRDKYLAAMFENTPESEEFLSKWHRDVDQNTPENFGSDEDGSAEKLFARLDPPKKD